MASASSTSTARSRSVMGHQGIAWLERPEREQEERLTLLVDSLGLEPGMVVADIGAGSGVISAMIADRIGAGWNRPRGRYPEGNARCP